MSTPIIALDIDGVLADFGSDFLRQAKDLHPDEGLEWWSAGGQQTWQHENLTTKQNNETWEYVYAHPEWWGGLSTIPSVVEIRELREFVADIDCHVEYITARGTARSAKAPEAITTITQMWLHGNRFPQPDNVTLAEDKAVAIDELVERIPGGQLLGLLDDRLATIADLAVMGYPVVARDWPYNRSISQKFVPRVYSLGEFTHLMRLRVAAP
ncbi:hypothetical protein LCGC14_0826200 [marine sediment metagenome]|uniref:Uncharacterized protein n=1 Tax=marine sediment metagenome TaxID=412755 RepID=A0A0F9Q2I7_9ZZZZ